MVQWLRICLPIQGTRVRSLVWEESTCKESTCNAGDPGWIPGSGRSTGDGIGYSLQCYWASLMAQLVRNPPAMWETWVQSLGWEDPLDEGKDYPLRFSGLENSMDYIVRHDWVTFTFSVRDLRLRRDAAADAAEILSSTTKRWNGENGQMASSPSHHSKNLSHQLY